MSPESLTSQPTATGGDEFAETVIAALEPSDGRESLPTPAVAIDRYAVTSTLGEGGMGIVYEAEDRQFGRRVALKKISHKGRSRSLEQRFVSEAVVTANLEHPGVAPVYERGIAEDGTPFYTMRLVEGRTVREVVAERERLEDRLNLLPAMVRLAHTLAFAHERGVVHRDVKPDNVVLGRHGETVLLDWGIAKVRGMPALDASTDNSAAVIRKGTRQGAVVGTPSYMAPEQARGDVDHVDERTDVFALGALLYHVLTGKPPFADEPDTDILDKVKRVEVAPVQSLVPKAPAGLCAIVERAMRRSPDDRYQTAGEMADALEAFLGSALTGEGSRLIRALATVASGAAVLLMLVGTAVAFTTMPRMAELGVASYAYTFFFVASLALSIAEWRSRGRHRLMPLTLGLAAATVLTGVGNAFMGFQFVLSGVQGIVAEGQTARAAELLAAGSYEAFGNIGPACMFGATQLLVIGLVARSNMIFRATD